MDLMINKLSVLIVRNNVVGSLENVFMMKTKTRNSVLFVLQVGLIQEVVKIDSLNVLNVRLIIVKHV